MIDLRDSEIRDILPPVLARIPNVQALSFALHNAMKRLIRYFDKTGVFAKIDEMPDDVLSMLAAECNVPYYDENLSTPAKRELVKSALKWHQTAGTPEAVEELIQIVFGEGNVSEWYEYGGKPYTFRIQVTKTQTENLYDYFLDLVKNVKNIRSHLEGIEYFIKNEEPVKLHLGGQMTVITALSLPEFE